MTITFKVCKTVEINEVNLEYTKPFSIETFIKDDLKKKVIPLRLMDVFDQLIDSGVSSELAYSLAEEKVEKQKENIQTTIDDKFNKTIILGTSCSNDLFVLRNRYNSFVYSAWEAYNLHYHLIIRPDNIWLAIMTQFSMYVNKNHEELHDKFVNFTEKKTLEVFTEYSILKAPFDKLTIDMTNKISENIKDPLIREWIIPSFSTTTQSDKVVFSSVLMSTMKSYFNYSMKTRCGLPKVTMKGTIEDWLNLKERVNGLLQYNNKEDHIKKWVDYLNPVMDKFIDSISCQPDTEWWNKIVHHKQSSGCSSLTGWLTVFCVFDNDGKFQDNYATRYVNQPKGIWPTIDSNLVPNGYVSSPVLLTDADGTQYNSQLYSGHFASKIEDKTSIIPSLDWFIIANLD